MHLRGNLARPKKGTHTITEYMQDIKINIDTLALMNVNVDFDELSIRILDGLDDHYKDLSHALQVRESPVTFDELLEQLLNYEAKLALKPDNPTSTPAAVFVAPLEQSSRSRSRGISGNSRGQSHSPQSRFSSPSS